MKHAYLLATAAILAGASGAQAETWLKADIFDTPEAKPVVAASTENMRKKAKSSMVRTVKVADAGSDSEASYAKPEEEAEVVEAEPEPEAPAEEVAEAAPEEAPEVEEEVAEAAPEEEEVVEAVPVPASEPEPRIVETVQIGESEPTTMWGAEASNGSTMGYEYETVDLAAVMAPADLGPVADMGDFTIDLDRAPAASAPEAPVAATMRQARARPNPVSVIAPPPPPGLFCDYNVSSEAELMGGAPAPDYYEEFVHSADHSHHNGRAHGHDHGEWRGGAVAAAPHNGHMHDHDHGQFNGNGGGQVNGNGQVNQDDHGGNGVSPIYASIVGGGAMDSHNGGAMEQWVINEDHWADDGPHGAQSMIHWNGVADAALQDRPAPRRLASEGAGFAAWHAANCDSPHHNH